LEVLIFVTYSFPEMKYCKSKYQKRISDARLHDTPFIAASSMEPNIAKCNKQGRLVSHIEYMLQLPRKENVWQYQGHCQWCPAPHLKSVLPDFTFGLTNYHETVKMPCAVVDGHQAITC